MPRSQRGSKSGGTTLRGRLLILLAIMVLPFVAFSVFKGQEINRSLFAEHQEANLALARSVAYSIDDYVLTTGELLNTISDSKAAREGDHAALARWFSAILPEFEHYANIIYVDNEGQIQAAGRESTSTSRPISVADTVYYERSMATTGLAVGDFMYGKISGNPVVHICFPVFDDTGARQGFVAAAMHLNRVQRRLMRESTPAHTAILVLDRTGTVIARNRDPEEWVGTNVYEELRVKDMVSRREGDDEAVLRSGERLVCSYTDVDAVPWFVRVGIREDFIAQETAIELGTHYAVFLPLLLVAIGGWLWIGRDVDKLHKHAEQLSLTDSLTGLGNSRSLRDDSVRAFQHAERGEESLAVAMLDLDNFKAYNDRFGHVAGDEALQASAQAIADAIRGADKAYRYGGEEFCILLPDADHDGAASVAERVRQAVAAIELQPHQHEDAVGLTISIGVAAYPVDAADIDELISCADVALYRAKHAGKNRVVVGCGG